MGLNLGFIDGQTPLDENEKVGLLIPTVTTRGELDEFEQQNIEEALQWVLGKKLSTETILSEKFIRNLHKRMYGQVWSWAGNFRSTNKNIGVDKWQISVALKQLCDDTLYWINNNTYPPDEVAIRFKHRIVSIHCFPNGNGRHSRIMADIIIDKIHGKPLFSWGMESLSGQGYMRQIYIQAVRKADAGDIAPLLVFARS
ncbi:MAG: mobile mystery protein B [Bacteroidetes bacterium]|nr:mobile mystery protein B [Bacteroidota bacterium]MCH8524981.1 mobile mystery protein B [Balneolales bacterium]